MVYILGQQHGVVNHGPLKMWADRGLVHIEDSRDNSYETHEVKEMLARIAAISDMMKHPIDGTESSKERKAIHEERVRQQDLIDSMIPVIRKAQEQGMPGDKTAINALKAATTKDRCRTRHNSCRHGGIWLMSGGRREAFKIGFLQKCAEVGLTVEETTDLAKQAADRIGKEGSFTDRLLSPVDEISEFLGRHVAPAALWGPILGAPVLGAGAGYGLSRMTDIDDEDVDAAKKRELIDLYRSHAARLKLRGETA